VAAIEWNSIAAMIRKDIIGPEAEATILQAIPVVIVAVLLWGVLSGLLVTWYAARLVRLLLGGTTAAIPAASGETIVRFSSTVTAPQLLWLFVSNFLIALITLGLGLPILLHRYARYIARTSHMQGAFDASTLHQSTLARPSVGEGFLQALDPGIV
jgi:uncharacterized membrane protein YjgN (DUF898 family)